MRRLVLHGPGRLAVEEGATAALTPGEVRVAPVAVGICGSDIHGYAGVNDRRAPGVVMGHEAAGRVVELGPGVTGLAVGDAVAVNPVVACGECDRCRSGRDNLCARRRLYGCVPGLDGGFADSLAVQAANLVPHAGPAPVEWAVLAEPLAVGAHAAGVLGAVASALVVGGGPIGIGAALAVRRGGCERVVVSEPDPHRRAVAEALGLEAIAPDAVEPGAFAGALECVGAAATLAAALTATWSGGRIVLVGVGAPELPLPVAPVVMEERTITGSAVYTRAEFAATARWVASGTVDLSPVIERRVRLEQLPEAFAAYATGAERATKTVMIGA